MKRLLLVEDDWAQYVDVKNSLEAEGFELAKFTSSFKEGKEQLEIFNPEIVLIDIDLNGPLNGFDLAQLIDEKYKIPYVFLSSYSHKEFRERAKKTKAKNYLVKQKPIHTEQLLIAIEFALEKEDKFQLERSGIFVLPMPKRDEFGNLIKEENDQRIQKKALLHFDEIVKITKGKGDLHHKIVFETTDQKQYCHPISLTDTNELLPQEFIRVERGIIVNLKHLSGKSNGRVLNLNGEEIPVGKTFVDQVKSILDSNFLDL